MGLPKPDVVFFLDAGDASRKLLDQRVSGSGERVGKEGVAGDIHEADQRYLEKSRLAGLDIAHHGGWKVVECSKNGSLLHREEIAEILYGTVLEELAKQKIERKMCDGIIMGR